MNEAIRIIKILCGMVIIIVFMALVYNYVSDVQFIEAGYTEQAGQCYRGAYWTLPDEELEK